MCPSRNISLLILLCTCSSGVAFGQSTVNPQISVIPRFLIQTNDGEQLSAGRRQFSRPDFSFQELELAIQSYLNPFSKADVILTVPGPDIENAKLGIEELYATVLRGLPLDLIVRFGKYRAEYGKLNMMHPHAWPFITQPLSQKRFIGEEGLNDLGISASVLLPTGDVYTTLTADLLRGNAVGGTTGIMDSTTAKRLYANTFRLSSFFTLDDYSDLEVGLSGYTGIHDPYNRDRFWYMNLDFKYKYRPSSYASLVLQGEVLYNTRTASQDGSLRQFVDANGNPDRRTINTAGMYLFADYQFFKSYSIGARYDWSQSPYSKDDKGQAVALFLGYYPVEETLGLRMEYLYTRSQTPLSSQSVNSISLQMLFSLGPHKAHPF